MHRSSKGSDFANAVYHLSRFYLDICIYTGVWLSLTSNSSHTTTFFVQKMTGITTFSYNMEHRLFNILTRHMVFKISLNNNFHAFWSDVCRASSGLRIIPCAVKTAAPLHFNTSTFGTIDNHDITSGWLGRTNPDRLELFLCFSVHHWHYRFVDHIIRLFCNWPARCNGSKVSKKMHTSDLTRIHYRSLARHCEANDLPRLFRYISFVACHFHRVGCWQYWVRYRLKDTSPIPIGFILLPFYPRISSTIVLLNSSCRKEMSFDKSIRKATKSKDGSFYFVWFAETYQSIIWYFIPSWISKCSVWYYCWDILST